MSTTGYIIKRYESVQNKIRSLSTLREVLDLTKHNDITERQWEAIQSQLVNVKSGYIKKLKTRGRELLQEINKIESRRELNYLLGKVELDLSRSFIFYDTFLDILSQRLIPGIGPLLKGCDNIAFDSIRKDSPVLSTITKPIVYFDRGFGASTRREGVSMSDGSQNPVTTIQIPYSKLRSKYSLTSIIHETGHSVMVRLGIDKELYSEIKNALRRAGADKVIQKGFSIWSKEIGPDFWGFLNCGISQAIETRELLSLPYRDVFNISFDDPHPPPYLRILLLIDWCRKQWGTGDWDEWESEWKRLYPMDKLSEKNKVIIKEAERSIHVVSRVLFNKRFRGINNKTFPSLFDMNEISPHRFKRILENGKASGFINLSSLSVCGQLGFFGYLRNKTKITESEIDKLMTKWLIHLGDKKISYN